MINNVVPIRTGVARLQAKWPSNSELAWKLVAILRRRVASPLQGKTIVLIFETEVEAAECQKILDKVRPKGSRRRRY